MEIVGRRALAGWLLMAAGFSSGCGNQAAPSASDPDPPEEPAQPAAALSFSPDGVVTIAPRESRELTVVVDPPAAVAVRFSLLSGSTGDGPADAALDRNEAVTDDQGRAQVVLTAPSAPVTFSVRAAIDGASRSIGVSVSASGFAELEVVPSYAGARPTNGWVATVRAGLTCDDPVLAGTPPPDGDLLAEGGGDDLVVDKVPVGPVLAVTARVAHYVGGCATVTSVREGDRNRVIVPISDRAIQLGATRLDVSFGFESASSAWDERLDAARESALGALRGGAVDDLAALLDALQTVVPEAEQPNVAAARLADDWDTALHEAYPGEGTNLLTSSAREWLDQGFDLLFAPDPIRGQLVASQEDPERAILTLLSVAGHPPAAAGLPETAAAAWSADSHDVLLIGTNFLWSPPQLLTALAQGPALAASPSAGSVARALASALNCSLVAETLLGVGEPADELYATCSHECAVVHCREAVAVLWGRVAATTALPKPLLSLSASGAALVGDQADVVGLDGSWVGRFSAENAAATAAGPFSAEHLGD